MRSLQQVRSSAGGFRNSPEMIPFKWSTLQTWRWPQTFKQHHTESGKETDEKDWKCENSRRHEPCSTKEPVQMVAGSHKGEYGASVEPLITRQARGVPVMVAVLSAYLTVHLKQEAQHRICSGSVRNMKQCVKAQSRHSLVSTASERETILDGRIQLTPLSGFFETLNLKHVFSPMHLQGFYTSNIFLLLLLL